MQTENKIERDASPNESQLKAIQTTESPLLIIAGPGSGKTFTLVERAFLYGQQTFNNKLDPRIISNIANIEKRIFVILL